MDPVAMMTVFPQLLASFIYKPATLADSFRSFQGLANSVRFLIARDMIISEVRRGQARPGAWLGLPAHNLQDGMLWSQLLGTSANPCQAEPPSVPPAASAELQA